MQTVESLIRELQKFPPQSNCWAYEGEVIGVVVDDLGYVPCTSVSRDDGPAVLDGPGRAYLP